MAVNEAVRPTRLLDPSGSAPLLLIVVDCAGAVFIIFSPGKQVSYESLRGVAGTHKKSLRSVLHLPVPIDLLLRVLVAVHGLEVEHGN